MSKPDEVINDLEPPDCLFSITPICSPRKMPQSTIDSSSIRDLASLIYFQVPQSDAYIPSFMEQFTLIQSAIPGGIANALESAILSMHSKQLIKLPLPQKSFEEKLIYVNAKQYCRIIKMREKKERKPKRDKIIRKYMHESRHKHAAKRARCPNGRFIPKKQNEKNEQPTESIKSSSIKAMPNDTKAINVVINIIDS